MDENYLDGLLNEISLDKEMDKKIENDLDWEMQFKNGQSVEEEMDLLEQKVEADFREAVIDESEFSESQLDELDQLDDLADLDLDMDSFDIDNIDFDDVDITKLDNMEIGDADLFLDGDLKNSDIESFSMEMLSGDDENVQESVGQESMEQESMEQESMEQESMGQESMEQESMEQESLGQDAMEMDIPGLDSLEQELSGEDSLEQDLLEQKLSGETSLEELLSQEPAAQSEDTDIFLDHFSFDEEFGSNFTGDEENTNPKMEEEEKEPQTMSELSQEPSSEEVNQVNNELDDLFSMLGIEDEEGEGADSSQGGISSDDMEFDAALSELDDIQDISEINKKRTFMQILFGDPDEGEEEGKTLEEIEAEKVEKAKKKEEKKALKAEKKTEKQSNKKEKAEKQTEKRAVKAQKKEAKKKEEVVEEPVLGKELSKPASALIFSLFAVVVFLLTIGTNTFSYQTAIKAATTYFENQKYSRAYGQIIGIEVKEKDEKLKGRIYTVMQVERLYESYCNNVSLNRYDKALDSLLRAVEKYDEHYAEAMELGVVADLNYSFSQVTNALSTDYGITLDVAKEINNLEHYAYIQRLSSYTEGMKTTTQ